MASNDKKFDPPVNYYSGSDDELNNTVNKNDSPSNSSQTGILQGLVVNDLKGDDGCTCNYGRRGGPQADNDTASGVAKAHVAAVKMICSNHGCHKETDVYYEGSRFICHRTRAKYKKEIDQHNTLCEACAFDRKRCPICPTHGNSYEANIVTPKKVKKPIAWNPNSCQKCRREKK